MVATDVSERLEFAEPAVMDDCLLWGGDKTRLEGRVSCLIRELGLWDLRVNPEKCQVYSSPFARERGPVRVGEMEVAPDSKLDVMGSPI